ncbi:MAG: hypothetical protein ABR530_00010 [Pyrinomonadaceae bacterium]
MLRFPRSASTVIAASTLLFAAVLAPGQQPAPASTPVAIQTEPTSFDIYVGQYEDAAALPGTVFSFFREGDKYYLRLTNQDKIEITPSAANKFFSAPCNFDVEFSRDSSGRVTGARFTQGPTYQLKKTSDTPQPDTRVPYKRTETMIPMRDGIKLFTVIITPENQSDKLPFYMERTPYGVAA